jgi:hypothetical protein
MTFSSLRRWAAGAAAILALAGCSHVTAKIEVGALNDEDTGHYLILSDQLRWRRDLEEARISRGQGGREDSKDLRQRSAQWTARGVVDG